MLMYIDTNCIKSIWYILYISLRFCLDVMAKYTKYIGVWITVYVFVFFVTRGWPFVMSIWQWGGEWNDILSLGIPLWYDPWLYKLMWQAYIQLWAQRDFALLPSRIQHMYEPWLWMRWALVVAVMGGGWGLAMWALWGLAIWASWGLGSVVVPDWILTRWWVAVSAFLPLCLYLVGRKISQPVAIFALLFGAVSCTQWEVFWRAYRKQLLWICLLLVTLRLWMDGRRWGSVPVVSAVFLVNRPAGALLVLIAAGRGIVQILNSWWWRTMVWRSALCKMGGVLIGGALVALPVGRVFVHDQIIALWGAFRQAFGDLPHWWDVYQQWWSFLTTIEYVRAWWWAIVGGLTGVLVWIYMSRNVKTPPLRAWVWIVVATVILLLRVFGQGFFFQRMIGYLDVFLILMMAYVCGEVWVSTRFSFYQKTMFWTILGGVITVTTVYFGMLPRMDAPRWEPRITGRELQFIKNIPTYVPADAVLIVPSRWYSPWVGWWSQREVIAPALFDRNVRSQDERAEIRLESTGEEICDAIIDAYGYLHDMHRPLYVVTWPREPNLDLVGSCFTDTVRDASSGMRLQNVSW